MQEKTKLELELLEKEEYQKVIEEWSKVNYRVNKAGRFGSDVHLELFLKVGSEYLDKILNKFFDTEQSTLKALIPNPPENYFIDLQEKIIHILEEKCNLILSNALQIFRTSIEAHSASINEQTIYENFGTLLKEKKEIELIKMNLLKVNIKQENSIMHQNRRTTADLDSLTKLWTRGCFDSELQKYFEEAKSAKSPLSIIMVDIDHFKTVNDTYGHPKGDEVLAGVASSILSITKNKGQPYRYGGEEMVVILNNYDTKEAMTVAERIRRNLESTPIAGISITASFGVGTFPAHGDSIAEIIKAADDALYDAKNRGRNLVRIYGELEPPKDKVREPERKLPSHSVLTEKEKGMIREQYFRGFVTKCPKDGAILEINEITELGKKTVSIHIWCKMCGLTEEL